MYVIQRKAMGKILWGENVKIKLGISFPKAITLPLKCSNNNGYSYTSPELPWELLDHTGIGIKGIFFPLGWWIYNQGRNIAQNFLKCITYPLIHQLKKKIYWYLPCVRSSDRHWGYNKTGKVLWSKDNVLGNEIPTATGRDICCTHQTHLSCTSQSGNVNPNRHPDQEAQEVSFHHY